MNTKTLKKHSLESTIKYGLNKLHTDAQAKIDGHFGDQHEKNTLMAVSDKCQYLLEKQIIVQLRKQSEELGIDCEIDEGLIKQLDYNQKRVEYCEKIKRIEVLTAFKLEKCESEQLANQIIKNMEDNWPKPPVWESHE